MWIISLIDATLAQVYGAADDPGTIIPVVGGGTLSAVLWFLLREEQKERREVQKNYDELLERMLPTFTAVTLVMERVSQALSKQVEYHEVVQPSPPEALTQAIGQLQEILDQYATPEPIRKRPRREPR